ncbi:MAG: DsrE/DsrF/DrsH-like family protein [Chloroflexi bacterium]|nr:DsrE/DsrF/DrsH-like family protein [Chloroflexota bacterium]
MTETLEKLGLSLAEFQKLHAEAHNETGKKRLAIVASKGSLDMVYPPLILATTATALGWECGIFFTFYGLDALNKKKYKGLKVAPLGNPAMPSPLKGLPVYVPNLVGAIPGMTFIATALMKRWMRKANVPSIEQFVEMAHQKGVKLIACSTTMGVMGIKKEDLLPEADIQGAAAFLHFASKATVTLFI